MEVGTTYLRKSFATKALLESPKRIMIRSEEGLFDRYEQTWIFEPAEHGGTMVEFHTDFELHSPLLGRAMGGFLDEAAKTMVSAFKHRARQIHGVDGTVPAKS
jgi:coenzyme Q-binding protein COQ10